MTKNKNNGNKTIIIATVFAALLLTAGFVFANRVMTAKQFGLLTPSVNSNNESVIGAAAGVATDLAIGMPAPHSIPAIFPQFMGCFSTATLHVNQIGACGFWRVEVTSISSTNVSTNSSTGFCCPPYAMCPRAPEDEGKAVLSIPSSILCRRITSGPSVTLSVYRYEPTTEVNRSSLNPITLTARFVNSKTLAPGQSAAVCLPMSDNSTTPQFERCLTLTLSQSGLGNSTSNGWATVYMRGDNFRHGRYVPLAARSS